MPLSGTVRELMTPLADFPHVYADQPLRDVFVMLKEKFAFEQFRTVLVFDRGERPAGRLTLHQLLRALLPEYLVSRPGHFEGSQADSESLALLWQDDCIESCRETVKQPVGNHMLPVARTIAPDAPLTLALFLFSSSSDNMIPVAESGRVIGVVRLVDLLKEITSAVLAEGETK